MELYEHIRRPGPPPAVPFGPPPPVPAAQTNLFEQMGTVFQDLYPYSPQDSPLWLELFIIADGFSRRLAECLVVYRGTGAWLVPDQQFGFAIQPIVDPTGMRGWESIGQYNRERDNNLIEHTNEIVAALRELRNRADAGKIGCR